MIESGSNCVNIYTIRSGSNCVNIYTIRSRCFKTSPYFPIVSFVHQFINILKKLRDGYKIYEFIFPEKKA